jgi:hypothetical protein
MGTRVVERSATTSPNPPTGSALAAGQAYEDAERHRGGATGRGDQIYPREQIKWEHPSHLIPKKNGKLRKIMNAATLNKYILKMKFKMEDQRLLMQLLQRNMFATGVDITSAYHHVPVASWAQPYLCFNYDSKTYCYRAMPFGLSTAPRTFTPPMRQCIKTVRQTWRVTAVHYLDDLLFLHHDKEYLKKATDEIVRLLSQVGWIINNEKSELERKQLFRYLGWEWDSRSPSLCLPQGRVKSLLHDLRAMRNAMEQQKTTTPRRLARLITSTKFLISSGQY